MGTGCTAVPRVTSVIRRVQYTSVLVKRHDERRVVKGCCLSSNVSNMRGSVSSRDIQTQRRELKIRPTRRGVIVDEIRGFWITDETLS